MKSKEINQYFTIIKRDLPEMREGAFDETVVDGKVIDSVYLSTTDAKSFKSSDSGYLINSKEYRQKINWISSVTKKLNYSYDQRSKYPILIFLVNIKDINVKLNWVYGIRCTDVLDSFCYYRK